ncbi:hypothetical protein [Pseudalkalibacillus salsuginis]|uniref:hypothetical protein n=1 Tax=Pseudalkalibacillus salsuginis TaxID=2910972 RepID=UPI001F467977|nr:hypothetical protein [Pseudalkalibacillus salsuginis]MCF6409976.1 hypothetical protein [Pseudalkalibacillus salsuginis]
MMIQPPHPIEDSISYESQVEAIEEFANDSEILFLNHWENWPDGEEVGQYLNDDQSGPNKQGNQVWAEYILNYFTGK